MTQIDNDTFIDLSFVTVAERNGNMTILHLNGTTATWNVPLETALKLIEINRRQASFATP